MAVDLRKVKKLIELVEESGICELEVSSGDESVRIVVNREGVPRAVNPEPIVIPAQTTAIETAPVTSGIAINSPMAGTFYVAPYPEAPAFIEVGQTVEIGDVICIIESMKMMHEVKASEAGVVQARCVENGEPVGTGDKLFELA